MLSEEGVTFHIEQPPVPCHQGQRWQTFGGWKYAVPGKQRELVDFLFSLIGPRY